MSAASLAKVEDAIREHLASAYEESDNVVMTDWVIGVASMHHVENGPCFHVDYAVSPMTSPHAAVGLFAMAADRQAQDLQPDDGED